MTTEILAEGRVTWTNIVRPDPADIQRLAERYPQFHPLNLEDCLTEAEFPKLDEQDGYLFLVVQMPLWDEKEHIARREEIDIFVAKSTLVTSHSGALPSLTGLFDRLRADGGVRQELMGHGASPLLYRLLDTCVNDCFPRVSRLDHDIRRVELNLFRDDTQNVLREIAVLRRELIAMRRILRPQLDVVRALERGNWPFIHDELDLYWSDISDHLAHLGSMLDEHSEVVSGLSDTIDTLASHRIDAVVRLLTVVTMLTLPLTLFTSVFGMNVLLPFSQHPLVFYWVIGLGLAFTLGLMWYLHRRRWL